MFFIMTRQTSIDAYNQIKVGKKLGMEKLPVVIMNNNRLNRNDRIASTIRHNRARGKHIIQAMSDIVIELKNRNWKNERIARELGMEEDEVLRLCQITGLASLFKDDEFSKSWDIKDSVPDEPVSLDDIVEDDEKEKYGFRTVNTNDPGRIFHVHQKWECYKAGFYNSSHPTMSKEECENAYAKFLKDKYAFRKGLRRVIKEWKYSCEHYLTNVSMNRIAWLGQAAVCIERGIPSDFRGGFHLLSEQEQKEANELALVYLNKWLVANNRKKVSLDEAMPERQSTIY